VKHGYAMVSCPMSIDILALNTGTAFQVELFSVDSLVLRHDCFKIDGDVHTLSTAKM